MEIKITTIGFVALEAGTGKIYKKAATAKGIATKAIRAKTKAAKAKAEAEAEAKAAKALSSARWALKKLNEKRETAIRKRRWREAKKWGHEIALIKGEFPSLR